MGRFVIFTRRYFSKVDRASMHYSLETRAPFLDARLVEVASKIPYSLKIKKNYGKHILRKLLYKYIPKQYFERPKSDLLYQSENG